MCNGYYCIGVDGNDGSLVYVYPLPKCWGSEHCPPEHPNVCSMMDIIACTNAKKKEEQAEQKPRIHLPVCEKCNLIMVELHDGFEEGNWQCPQCKRLGGKEE